MKKLAALVILLFFVLTPVLSFAAPNKVYMQTGTRLTFTDSGSSGADIDLLSLGTGAGKYSARYNKGGGSQPYLWIWDVSVQAVAPPTVGDVLELYVIKSDGTRVQGNLGTTKATLSSDKRKNISFAGVLVVDQTATSTTMTASGYVEVREPWFSMALWNATTVSLVSGSGTNVIGMTPVSLEIQAALPFDYDRHPPVPALALAA